MKKSMLFLYVILLTTALQAQFIKYDIKPKWLQSSNYMGITLLDVKEIFFDATYKFEEISALAYRDKTLYALNDKSHLFRFNLEIKNDKIKRLDLEKIIKLKDSDGEKLSKIDRDSEGMVVVGDKLLISFERNPRVTVYALNGERVKNLSLHKKLRDIDHYIAPNKALESLAYNRKHCLVTAPETPFRGSKYHTLYAKDKSWRFKAHGNITALEFIDEDRILILERDFNYFTRSRTAILSVVKLKSSKKVSKSKVIASFKSSDGWKLDNFEGLTRIDKNRFLVVSDDNDSLFQKTLLVLFKIDENYLAF